MGKSTLKRKRGYLASNPFASGLFWRRESESKIRGSKTAGCVDTTVRGKQGRGEKGIGGKNKTKKKRLPPQVREASEKKSQKTRKGTRRGGREGTKN